MVWRAGGHDGAQEIADCHTWCSAGHSGELGACFNQGPKHEQKANAGAVDSGVTVSSSIIPLSLTLTSVLTALNAQICNHTFSISPIYLTHFPHLSLPLCMSAHSRAHSLAAGTKHPIGWQHAQVSLAFPLNSPPGWITKWKWPQGFTGPPRSAHSSFSLSASYLLFSSGRTFTQSQRPEYAACLRVFFLIHRLRVYQY